MGDLNAKIGIPKNEEHLITKACGCGSRNERGQRLIEYARENKLSILNTFLKKKTQKINGPGDHQKKRNMKSILCCQIDLICLKRVGALNINHPSDHRPVRATISYDTHFKKSRVKFKICP